MICIRILRDLVFRVDNMTIPNEVWIMIEALFGNIDEMRGHHIENEMISLIPAYYETIQDFFTKFKSLVLQLKQYGTEKKYEKLIFSILSKLATKYSMLVFTFQSSKLKAKNWRMHVLA